MTDFYLGDFTFTEEETGEILQPDSSKEIKWTWTHNTLMVTPLSFCCREGHEEYEELKRTRKHMVLSYWAEELGYTSSEYSIDLETKTIYPSSRVSEEQKQNWLKPNGRNILAGTTVEEI